MSQTQPPASKLFIRSEVLAVIDLLNTLDDPSKLDKLKQLKRLHNIEDQDTVQRILVKELQRASSSRIIQVISELLMELGTILTLKAPLWTIIQNPKSSDELKDAANVILRQLGDASDPNLYLEYLDDPAGLINRETERMLEISSRNPEALIDFIDFIFSLPVGEQCNLIRSLQSDYPTEYLLNIFLPAILALPPYETQELILSSLGDLRSKRAALFLAENQGWFTQDAHLAKVIKKSVNALKIGGYYREDSLEEARKEQTQAHALVTQSKLYQCFATIPDGIGNQGIVISRERENGDIVMMSVAINDLHGVIDCFGFYELSRNDFHKLLEKFHEENTKVHTPYAYCLYKLRQAEAINHKNHFRIPYEYGCWQALLTDPVQPADPSDQTGAVEVNPLALCNNWANQEWTAVSASLYQHPDFSTWFLEEGDHPVVTALLENVLEVCTQAMANLSNPATEEQLKQVEPGFLAELDKLAEAIVHGLLATEWRDVLINRLADAAYLLHEQKAGTFGGLAATEVQKLQMYQGKDTPLTGFIRHYGRRCVEEDLLRLKNGALNPEELKNKDAFEHLVEHVLTAWEL
jgi:hypothetical protein